MLTLIFPASNQKSLYTFLLHVINLIFLADGSLTSLNIGFK